MRVLLPQPILQHLRNLWWLFYNGIPCRRAPSMWLGAVQLLSHFRWIGSHPPQPAPKTKHYGSGLQGLSSPQT